MTSILKMRPQASVLVAPPRSRLRSSLFRLLMALAAWQQRARDRQHLRELDDRLLRDVGLTRAQVAREANLPFWHVPRHNPPRRAR